MRNILIVKGTPASGEFTTVAELESLGTNYLSVLGDGKQIIAYGDLPPVVNSIEQFSLITKFTTGALHSSVSIPRRNVKVNVQTYSPPQVKVITLGGTTGTTTLNIPTEGEGVVIVKSLSYNHAISTQKVIVSLQKKPSQTPEQYVDALVLKLNNTVASQATPFFTAAKVVAAGNLGITFTTIDENVDLFVGKDGILVDELVSVTQEAIAAIGKGADIVQMERDMSRNQGFQGYVQNTDLWYKQPIQADANESYDMITLEWDGIAPSPTVNKAVMINSITLAMPTDTILEDVITLIQLLIGQAYSPTTGVETGNEPDVNAIDNA